MNKKAFNIAKFSPLIQGDIHIYTCIKKKYQAGKLLMKKKYRAQIGPSFHMATI